MEEKIKSHETEDLIEMIQVAFKKTGEAAEMVQDLIMDELEIRLPENKFNELCDKLFEQGMVNL